MLVMVVYSFYVELREGERNPNCVNENEEKPYFKSVPP